MFLEALIGVFSVLALNYGAERLQKQIEYF
jgi:hypothetical protein